MRILLSTANLSSAATPVQISTDGIGRLSFVQFTNRSAVPVYLGHSSAVSSAAGYKISSAGGNWPSTGPLYFNATRVAPSAFWFTSSASTGKLDYAFGVEP